MVEIIKFWHITGFFFILIAGTLFHFLYDWTGRNVLVGLISPINESVWEHLKLILYPVILFSAFEYLAIGIKNANYTTAKAAGIIISLLVIVLFFYGYTALLGRHYLVLDLLIFTVAAAVGQLVSYKILTEKQLPSIMMMLSIVVLLFIILLFSLFTFYPPRLPLFKNGPDGTYGINK